MNNHMHRVSILNEFDDEMAQIHNYDEIVFNVLRSLLYPSDNAQHDEYEYLSSFYIQVSLNDAWQNTKLSKVLLMDSFIDKLVNETHQKCKTFDKCKCFTSLRLEYDVINNDILSKFVDIDALIDDHGNDIAILECSVLPYLSTNKNRMLKQLTS